MKKAHSMAFLMCALLAFLASAECFSQSRSRWTPEQADTWFARQGWLAGCNYIPHNAINPLEMWQKETFDPTTIDCELGWAERIGFNCMRVFLHYLLWEQDSAGYLQRISAFLDVAARHKVRVMFVLFDDVWHPVPKLGPQPAPIPFVHNSGWVQCPGAAMLRDSGRHNVLERYVKGILRHFKDDQRVVVWDIYNEPANLSSSYRNLEPENKELLSLNLLTKVFQWSREVAPSQPITAGVYMSDWDDAAKINVVEKYMLENSDVISFHNYDSLAVFELRYRSLVHLGRPIVCTEYIARSRGNTFQDIMPFLKRHSVWAINWGFVSGKTQTIYPWDSWKKKYTREPRPWFHDVLRSDGTPYDANEVELIKKLTSAK